MNPKEFKCWTRLDLYEASATLEDDLGKTGTLARENMRTMEQVADFMQQCADKAVINRSFISTCDSLIQKLEY